MAETDVRARFWSKATVGPADQCWEWLANRNEKGYGTFYREGGTRKAHRVAYELANGPLSARLEVDHLCRNRACVNPAHLEAVTHKVNALRALGMRSSHCAAGHRRTKVNTYTFPNGDRRCRICHAARERRRHARRKAG